MWRRSSWGRSVWPNRIRIYFERGRNCFLLMCYSGKGRAGIGGGLLRISALAYVSPESRLQDKPCVEAAHLYGEPRAEQERKAHRQWGTPKDPCEGRSRMVRPGVERRRQWSSCSLLHWSRETYRTWYPELPAGSCGRVRPRHQRSIDGAWGQVLSGGSCPEPKSVSQWSLLQRLEKEVEPKAQKRRLKPHSCAPWPSGLQVPHQPFLLTFTDLDLRMSVNNLSCQKAI